MFPAYPRFRRGLFCMLDAIFQSTTGVLGDFDMFLQLLSTYLNYAIVGTAIYRMDMQAYYSRKTQRQKGRMHMAVSSGEKNVI